MSLIPFFGEPFGGPFSTLFDFPLLPPNTRGPTQTQRAIIQPMDIEETEKTYELYCDCPGMSAEEIELQYNDTTQVLTIKAEHSARKQQQEAGGYTRTERTRRSFQRSFTIPSDSDPEKIGAHVENGVLNVHIPKKAPVQPAGARKIAVQAVPHRSQIEGTTPEQAGQGETAAHAQRAAT